jgi:ubiquinone/menaquinone biosynthesis C-methylase UbiE
MDAPPLTPLAAAVLHVEEPERVLAVECGDGDSALFLVREFPHARVRGVDRSERAVVRASGRVGLDPEARIAFKPGSPSALPFPDQQFDLIVVTDASPDPGETSRVLRPGGFLIVVETHRHHTLFGLQRRLLRRRLISHKFANVLEERAGTGAFAVHRLEPVR